MTVMRAAGCLIGVGAALFVGCSGSDDSGGSTTSAATAGAGGTSAGGTSAGGTSAGGTSAGGTSAGGTSAGGGGGKSGGGVGGSKPTSCPSTVTICSAGKETTFSCDPCSSPFMQDCNAPDFHVKCAGGTCVPQGMSCGGAGAGGAGAGGAGTGGGGASGSGSAGASGGGAAGAGGAAGSPIGGGPFTIVYAAESIGVDVRTNTAATFDAAGLASYDALPMEKPARGSCTVADAGGDATAVFGRWTAGTTTGSYFGKTFMFAVNEGFHYVIGASTQALPASGTVGYTLLGATAPTLKGGGSAPGTTTGSANVAFAAGVAKIGLSFDVVVDAKYTLSTTGGTADPSTSELATVAGAFKWGGLLSVSGAGVACQSANGKPCQAFVQGAFVGPDGDHLAVNFAIQTTGNGGDGVHGVVLLRK